jgi:hypothetical protein
MKANIRIALSGIIKSNKIRRRPVAKMLSSAFLLLPILNQFMEASVIPLGKPRKNVKAPIAFGDHNLSVGFGSIEG